MTSEKLTATIAALIAVGFAASLCVRPANAESLRVQAGDGYMNVRTGPGTNFALIGTVPNGTTFKWSGQANCVPRQDGIVGADWCKVNWNGSPGWVSRVGLLPVAQEPAPALATPQQGSGADVVCDRPVVLLGDDPKDTNPVIYTEVSYAPADHAWRVFHHLANGGVVSRTEQYAVVDLTSETKVQWAGSLNRNRSIYMIGEVKFNERREPSYLEWIYNRDHGNQIEMSSRATCHWNKQQELPQPSTRYEAPTPQRQAEVVAPSQPKVVQTVPVKRDVVKIAHVNGHLEMNALVGGQLLRMIVDTGATHMSITRAVADRIVKDLQGSWQGKINVRMANGSVVEEPVVAIESVRVGSHTINNVMASVSSGELMLMPLSILNAIGAFKIDVEAGELEFTARSLAKGD